MPTWKLWKHEVNCIINSYPKEWLVHEISKDPVLGEDFADLKSFEPFWKLILGNKALLPLLWSMYPNHPNLLPAFYEDPREEMGRNEFSRAYGDAHWVSKPLFGREGIGLFFSSNFSNYDDFIRMTDDNYGKDSKSGSPLGKSIY